MKPWIKYFLCLCLVLFALGILLPGSFGYANAADIGEEGYWSFNQETGVLTIYGTGEMEDYSGIVGYYPPWEDWDQQITEVVISEGITVIGSEAFCGCENLTRVTLPSTLKTIKDGAFWYCESLESISIPKNVTQLEPCAFDYCSSLQEILVHPENPNYTSVQGILYNKGKTELLRCPEGIGGSVTIPEGTVKIETSAFAYCTSLTEVRLPGTVREMGYSVFYGCASLEHADLSALNCGFEVEIFDGCSSLTRIDLSEKHPTYRQDAQGALYSTDMTRLIFCPEGFSGTFVIPNGVKRIESYAFEGCTSLKAVKIPYGVKAIGESAFAKCTALETVKIPAGVEDIQYCAFAGCTALTSVALPKGIETLNALSFEGCTSLKTVEIPETVIEMEGGVFRGCTALQRVTMHYGLQYLHSEAFGGCESLETVIIPDSVVFIGEYAFENCYGLKTVVMPSDLSPEMDDTIWCRMFFGCDNLREIYFRGTTPNDAWGQFWFPYATYYYVEGQEGWTSPSWNGVLTATWSGSVMTDIWETDYYYTPVKWAMEAGITTGVGKERFRPEDSCTRGQIVTFLWRAAGCPEPETTECPFTDVSEGAYYYKAVLWAVEQGITKGVGRGRFDPEGTCTRGQVATFLWRTEGQPAPTTGEAIFTDVSADTYYAQAVLWAVKQGITNGVGKGRFDPDGLCTRGQIVTFLWRNAGEPTVGADLSPYCTVLHEKMADPEFDSRLQEGMLCDLDGDGVQELILTDFGNNWISCDVYTIRDGEIVPLMEREGIKYMVGGNWGCSGVAELQGKLYFYTYGRSSEPLGIEGYEYVWQDIMTWKFYSLETGELSLKQEVHFDVVGGYSGTEYIILPQSGGTINGEAITHEEYVLWEDSISILRSVDGFSVPYDDCIGFTLEELLQICK